MNKDLTASAAHYANALFELAVEGKCEQDVLADLKLVDAVVAQNPELKIVLKHPAVSHDDKIALVKETFKKKVCDLSERFLCLLTDRRKLELVGFVFTEYQKLWLEKQRIAVATITYAERPDTRVIDEIRTKLAKKLDKDKVELEEKEDRSLIGGYMLRIGDRVIDGSLKGRLSIVEKALLSV